MGKTVVKEIIHAQGIDISIYTRDFEFLGLWECLHNSNFNPIEFEGFKNQAGSNAFTMSPKKWIEATRAIGIVSKAGRYGGTFAHTDAIKSNLIPPELTQEQIGFTYASEADMLNVALFGKTAKQWRIENPEKKGNIRDYQL